MLTENISVLTPLFIMVDVLQFFLSSFSQHIVHKRTPVSTSVNPRNVHVAPNADVHTFLTTKIHLWGLQYNLCFSI